MSQFNCLSDMRFRTKKQSLIFIVAVGLTRANFTPSMRPNCMEVVGLGRVFNVICGTDISVVYQWYYSL